MSPGVKERKSDRATFVCLTIASSVLLASILTIHNIAGIHGGNLEGFHFALHQIYYISVPLFLAVSVLCTVPALILWGKLLRVYAFTVFFLAGLVWIYSSLIVVDFGLLDGTQWDFSHWERYRTLEIAGLVLAWFALGLVTIARPKIALYFAVFLNIALLLPSLYALAVDPKDASLERRANLDAALRFSQQQNVLIVLMDAFQSDLFADLVEGDAALAEALRGFEFFPDNLGVARSTALTLPAIHSGAAYSPEDTVREFYNRGVGEDSFLNSLAAAGYEVTLINPIQRVCPARIELCLDGEELLHGKWQMLLMEAAYLLDLSLFRAVPLFAKEKVYNGQFWVIAPTVRNLSISIGRHDHHIVEDNRLLEVMARRGSVVTDRPVAKFIHLLNTHQPYILGPDCRVRSGAEPYSRANAMIQARCGLEAFLRLVEFLKQQEIYDQSLIFLIADTGATLTSTYTSADDGTESWRRLVGNANPLFLVKAPGARGPLREIFAGIQPSDIPATVCALVDKCSANHGISVFDAESAPPRARSYINYTWLNRYWGKDELPNTRDYTIHGPVWSPRSWAFY